MPERTGHAHHSVPETDAKRAASAPEIHKEETRHAGQGILNRGAKGVPFYTPEQVPPAGTALDPQPNGQPIPKLFTPLKIRDMTMQNRIMVSPMCQYSADKGKHTPWHTTHLGGIVQRGPGLTMVEATAVQANGRITPEDSGLWNELQVEPLRAHVEFAHSQGQKIGIQLGHAGRKASTVAPWLASAALATADVGGWPDDVVAPSAGAYNEAHATPRALSLGEIEGIKRDFIAAAGRAIKCGFDALELHAAHGYLLHEFLSPATNRRTDEYGGAFEHRIRLLLEIVNETRKIMPATMPLFVRVSATDWLEDADCYEGESWTVTDTIRLAEQLAGRGVDVIDVSSGGLDPRQKITPGPGYQAPFAKAIKKALGDKILVATVGGITSGRQADELLVGSGASGNDEPLDIIVAGRGFQKNPSLVWSWADELDTSIYLASQIGWGFGGRSSRTSKAT